MVPSHIMLRYYNNYWNIFYIDRNKREYYKNPKKWMGKYIFIQKKGKI